MGFFESSKYLIKWNGLPGDLRQREIPEIFNEQDQLIGNLDLTGKISKKLLVMDATYSTLLSISKKHGVWK